jgi:hypothetical protein
VITEEHDMKKTAKRLALGLSLPALLLADFSFEAPLGIGFVRDAVAIVGAPMTPGSVAGVARRTTRRVVAVESAAVASTAAASSAAASRPPAPPPSASAGSVPVGTVIQALPPGCAATSINGVEYYNCAPGVYYRAAFQGNNLVYVSTQP